MTRRGERPTQVPFNYTFPIRQEVGDALPSEGPLPLPDVRSVEEEDLPRELGDEAPKDEGESGQDQEVIPIDSVYWVGEITDEQQQ